MAPKKIFRARESYAPWMTADMRKRKIQRDIMHTEAVETGDWAAYKVFKNKLRDDLRKAEYEWKTQYLDFEADGMDDKVLPDCSLMWSKMIFLHKNVYFSLFSKFATKFVKSIKW